MKKVSSKRKVNVRSMQTKFVQSIDFQVLNNLQVKTKVVDLSKSNEISLAATEVRGLLTFIYLKINLAA